MRRMLAARRFFEFVTHAWSLSRAVVTGGDRAWVLIVALLMPVKARVPMLRERALPLRIHLDGEPRTVWISDRSHIWILEEVWAGEGYKCVRSMDVDVVLDLGANVGLASLYFLSRFPQARIVAVEPDPASAALLRRNLASAARATVVEAAVGPVAKRQWLDGTPLSWGKHLVNGEAHPGPGVEVEVTTVDRLLCDVQGAGTRVLVKMDIEGSEWEVLREAAWVTQIEELIGEWHADTDGASPAAAFFEAVGCRAGMDVRVRDDGLFHLMRPGAAAPSRRFS